MVWGRESQRPRQQRQPGAQPNNLNYSREQALRKKTINGEGVAFGFWLSVLGLQPNYFLRLAMRHGLKPKAKSQEPKANWDEGRARLAWRARCIRSGRNHMRALSCSGLERSDRTERQATVARPEGRRATCIRSRRISAEA